MLRTLIAAVVLAAMASPTWSASRGSLVPQYSEDLRPAFTPASKAGAARLEFSAFDRRYRLRLSINERLARLAVGSPVQLYKGAIEGTPGSWARITVHEGLPRGMIWDGRELFVVDAAPDGVNDGAAGTVMFKLSDAVLEQTVSFDGDAVEVPRDAAEAYDELLGELRASAQAQEARVASQGVGISILADAAFLARYDNEARARDAIFTRLNNVDGIFGSQLGVELQVESVEIAGALVAGLSATTNPSALLKELGQLRTRSGALNSTGLTHLFTGRDLDGEIAGIAYTLALCSPRYAASLTMAHNSLALDTLTIAHEIGHVFGAPHDGVERCATTPQRQYIMTPALDTSVTSFSQCSIDEINAVIDSYACVVALPDPAPSTPVPVDDAPDSSGASGERSGGGALDPLVLVLLLLMALARGHRYTQSKLPRWQI